MDVEEFRTKPSWEGYEASLLTKGFVPCFEPGESPLPITCCRCGAVPTYITLTDGTTTLGFLACGPSCGDWIGGPIPEQALSTGRRPGGGQEQR